MSLVWVVLYIGLLKSVEVHQITLSPEDVHSLVLSGQIIIAPGHGPTREVQKSLRLLDTKPSKKKV